MCTTLLQGLINGECASAAPGVINAYAVLVSDIDTIPAVTAFAAGTASGLRITTAITLAVGKYMYPVELNLESGNKINTKWNSAIKRFKTVVTGKVLANGAEATSTEQFDFQADAWQRLLKGKLILLVEMADGPGYQMLGTVTNPVKANDNSQYDSGASNSEDPHEFTLEFEWRSHSKFQSIYTSTLTLPA